MGCNSSKQAMMMAVNMPDDSVHAMLEHDRKSAAKKGQQIHGYVPRAPHPLLSGGALECSTQTVKTNEDETASVESQSNLQAEVDALLYHTKNHGDTVDPRDYQDTKSSLRKVHEQ